MAPNAGTRSQNYSHQLLSLYSKHSCSLPALDTVIESNGIIIAQIQACVCFRQTHIWTPNCHQHSRLSFVFVNLVHGFWRAVEENLRVDIDGIALIRKLQKFVTDHAICFWIVIFNELAFGGAVLHSSNRTLSAVGLLVAH